MRIWFLLFFIFCSGEQIFGDEIQISSGLNIYSFDYRENLPYREDLEAQLKSTEAATVIAPFVQGRLPLPRLGPVYVLGHLEGTAARSHFDGTTLNGKPVTDTNVHVFFKAEADLYAEIIPSWFAFMGIGYSYWNRFLSGGSGYREIYTWGYIPIGLRYERPISKDLNWSLEASYRTMFAGQIVIIFSETVINGQDNTLTLGNRPGQRLQSTLDMNFRDQWKIFFSPWYEYSEIGESNYEFNRTVNGLIQEPSSRTIQYGVASGLTYRF